MVTRNLCSFAARVRGRTFRAHVPGAPSANSCARRLKRITRSPHFSSAHQTEVDIDFLAFIARWLIDSIASRWTLQSRRRWPSGELHVFRSEHQRAEAFFRETAQIADRVFALQKDPLGLEAVKQFFTLYYLQHNPPDGQRWDTKDICGDYKLIRDNPNLPFHCQYRTVADKFRFIESEQVPVLIPFDETAKALLADLRNEAIPLYRALLRGLQRYTVQIYRSEFAKNPFESVRDEQFYNSVGTRCLSIESSFGLRHA